MVSGLRGSSRRETCPGLDQVKSNNVQLPAGPIGSGFCHPWRIRRTRSIHNLTSACTLVGASDRLRAVARTHGVYRHTQAQRTQELRRKTGHSGHVDLVGDLRIWLSNPSSMLLTLDLKPAVGLGPFLLGTSCSSASSNICSCLERY